MTTFQNDSASIALGLLTTDKGIYKLSKEDVRIYLEGLQSIKETNEEIE